MSSQRHHRLATVYTIIFFALVAALSYWHLYRLYQTADLPNTVPLEKIRLDLSTPF